MAFDWDAVFGRMASGMSFFLPVCFCSRCSFFFFSLLNSAKEAGFVVVGINKFRRVEDVNKLLSRALEIFILKIMLKKECMYVCMYAGIKIIFHRQR